MLARTYYEYEKQCQKPGAEFTIQVVARGTVTDAQTEFRTDRTVQAVYLVETTTIRVNPTAQNMWLDSKTLYGTPEENGLTRQEFELERARREELRAEFEVQVQEDLGIVPGTGPGRSGTFAIGHIVSEFFTVVTIRKVAETPQTAEKPQTTESDVKQ